MGIILDSSVVIRSERLHLTEAAMVRRIFEAAGEQPMGLTTVVATELLHGIYRARTPEQRRTREAFLEQIIRDIPVYPYTLAIARLAARIGGKQASLGHTIDFADLLIGATALWLGYDVLTSNERHFRMIPGVNVIAF